jgi:hypothetical protein
VRGETVRGDGEGDVEGGGGRWFCAVQASAGSKHIAAAQAVRWRQVGCQ